MKIPGRQQQPPTDVDESTTPKDKGHRRPGTHARTYADILKPKATRGPPPTSSKTTSIQPARNMTSQKNYASPRTDTMGGGIQDLLTNMQQAFETLSFHCELSANLEKHGRKTWCKLLTTCACVSFMVMPLKQ